jgi:hypothetical protein
MALTLFLGPFGSQRMVIASPDTQISEPMEADTCFTRASAMNQLLWNWKGEASFDHNIIAVFCISTKQRSRYLHRD